MTTKVKMITIGSLAATPALRAVQAWAAVE
jgi:hypothetical protein